MWCDLKVWLKIALASIGRVDSGAWILKGRREAERPVRQPLWIIRQEMMVTGQTA